MKATMIAMLLASANLDGNAILQAESQAVERAIEENRTIRAWRVAIDKDGNLFQLLDECREGDHCEGGLALTKRLAKERQAALEKFEKSLARGAETLAVIDEIKVWNFEDGHGHDHGAATWVKFRYHGLSVYIQCHPHDDGETACHYKKKGEGEPRLLTPDAA